MVTPFRTALRLTTIVALATFSLNPASADCGPDALGTARVLPVDVAATPRVGLKHFPTTLPLAEKEVVLTFDDGPLAATTPRVLAALAKECVRATFFLIGRNAAANPALVRRIAEAGHTVAHHTMQHRILSRIPEAAALQDIDKGVSAVDQALGKTAAPFFRFPGFASNPALLEQVAARKMAVFGADFWVSDWDVMTPEQELAQITARLAAARRGIVLMHDTRSPTVAMLPAFLRHLKAGGYRIVHVVPRSNSAADASVQTTQAQPGVPPLDARAR